MLDNINKQLVKYGLNHFLTRYGLKGISTYTEKNQVIVEIHHDQLNTCDIAIIMPIIAQSNPTTKMGNITGYLRFDNQEIPLFITPAQIEPKAGDTTFAYFQNSSSYYPCVVASNDKLIMGFNLFVEAANILSGVYDSYFLQQTQESRRTTCIPVVDILEMFIFDCIRRMLLSKGIRLTARPFWPEEKPFALCLSHDVDRVYKTYQYARSLLRSVLTGNISSCTVQIRSMLTKHGNNNPFWCFDRIISLEEELGVKSTFYFLNESGRLNPFNLQSWLLFTGGYRIDDPNITNVIKQINTKGWEIGLHGSYYSFKNENLLLKEKWTLEDIVDNEISGIRQHYLNFDPDTTFEIQDSIGFRYDTTLGFNEGIGFRRGTCFPFHPYNPKTGEAFTLIEIPLIVMDCAIFSDRDLLDQCLEMMNKIASVGGVLTILWHQRMFCEQSFPEMSQTYKELIQIAKGRNAWITTSDKLQKWIRKRDDENTSGCI